MFSLAAQDEPAAKDAHALPAFIPALASPVTQRLSEHRREEPMASNNFERCLAITLKL